MSQQLKTQSKTLGKKKRQKKKKPTAKKVKAVRQVTPFWENRAVLTVVLLPLLSATAFASTFDEKGLIKFFLVFVLVYLSTQFSQVVAALLRYSGKIDTYHSLRELKDSIESGKIKDSHIYALAKFKTYLFILAFIVLLAGVLYFTPTPLYLSLLLATCLSLIMTGALPIDSPRRVVLVALSIIVILSALAVISFHVHIDKLRWPLAIVGFAPGTVLASAFIIFHSEFLKKCGWKLTREVKANAIRPGKLTNIASLSLFTGPCLAFSLAAFNQVPAGFILSGFVLYKSSVIATSFRDGTVPSHESYISTLLSSLGMSVICVLSGIIFRIF